MARRYNIQDIAQLAGVSRGTVSRVLNDSPAVSADTRKRVLDVIEQMNYLPSFSARHMRTNNSNRVGFGLITDEVITTPYAVEMISGAQETLWAQGKVMLVVNAGYGKALTEVSLAALLERRVEGIIYATMFHHSVELPPQIAQVPVVLANCYTSNRTHPSIVPDEAGGGYTATKTLLEKGHRRIGFINLSAPKPEFYPIPAAVGRLAGYKQALAEYDLPFDTALLRHTDGSAYTIYRYVEEFVHLPNAPTAIFCGNDRTAMSCYGGLAQLGLRIPDDMAVIGFDNQLDIAQGLWPPLTTIQLPHYAMGKWAVEYLMSEHSGDPDQHKLDCPLVMRESV
ncbi:MAG TPA: LacI family DNA-binding transcriptional regulator [Phototrophicaceae bacterium]|nr:LacI family DNA-binding transcriptional regulator [Phototrophicaceae bacterium]